MELADISQMAQHISFAFEDNFNDKEKRELFHSLFNRYLAPVDPAHRMDPYDAIIKLARTNRDEFDQMIREMKEASLISD